ncbi:hypothetical protein L228DRAFT_236059 [Xylona heveae TC161]|uniref:F-box domain-containing protein n=1 Tax=Xylona heveae (strain CBS 132557 / TC161) TaxID=1328760 RepID=A0A165IHD8_XYLHT|nr:hypothetical protein L228DRAFT_236059 [Xylona heveae TC161]KZF24900.1 hypothetical protein L228DRAFT_236059 [Xylona heveae TC161]
MSDERPPPPPPIPLPPPNATATSQESFPFFKLPTEIRLHIYRLLLRRDKPVLLRSKRAIQRAESAALNTGNSNTSETPIVAYNHALDAGVAELRAANGTTSERSARVRRRSIQRNNNTHPLGHTPRISAIPPLIRPQIVTPYVRENGRLPGSPPQPTNHNSPSSSTRRPCAPPRKVFDPIDPTILMTCKLVCREARPILYSENVFELEIETAVVTLVGLHQRTRSLIRHVRLVISSHHDILEQFTDVVRLGLRYCWGLRTFVIVLPQLFPENTGPLDEEDEEEEEDDELGDDDENENDQDAEDAESLEFSAAAAAAATNQISATPTSISPPQPASAAPRPPPLTASLLSAASAPNTTTTTTTASPTSTPVNLTAGTTHDFNTLTDPVHPSPPPVISPPTMDELNEPRIPLTGRTVYTNAFHILRWLPRQTKVTLEGVVDEDIARVVDARRKQGARLSHVSPPVSPPHVLLGLGWIS